MFGKKKKEKSNVKTYIDGVEESEEIPTPLPPVDVPALEPQAVQEPTHQQEQQVVNFDGDCILCFDYGFYQDNIGVWHNCPRCNAKGLRDPTKIGNSKKDVPQIGDDKPLKGPLYEFRNCEICDLKNEVHKRKKKWKCEFCDTEQEV